MYCGAEESIEPSSETDSVVDVKKNIAVTDFWMDFDVMCKSFT